MSAERSTVTHAASLEVGVPSYEPIQWMANAHVQKWDDDATKWVSKKTGLSNPLAADFLRFNVAPYAELDRPGNLLTTAGLTRITSLIIAGGGQGATNTSARTGVGNGVGTAGISDTDLSASSGSSNRYFLVMDATYPTASAGVLTFKSSFGSSDGNFAWNEWGIDIGTPTVSSGATVSAVLLNHKTSAALGTKASGSTWALTTTITIS